MIEPIWVAFSVGLFLGSTITLWIIGAFVCKKQSLEQEKIIVDSKKKIW